MRSFVFGALLALAQLAPASLARAEQSAPMPLVTIYPREIIRADMIETRELPFHLVGAGAIAETLAEVVGKASRATLLPGRPIPLGSIEEPRIVRIGAQVKLVFSFGGVLIAGAGTALEAGGRGERIRVRNTDSNAIVTGAVKSDGSVEVGDM
jgi:flagellar basal body P-ring formation protein FlgA